MSKPTWEEFRRFTNRAPGAHPDDFYGCVGRDGEWFDSAWSFDTAVHWCCCFMGQFNLTTAQEIEWMNDEGHKLGLSVIHGTQIKRMYEAGLIN